MRQFFQKENIFFWVIIFIAAVLRFYNYWNWSFSHDEIGAFVRLNYSSFSELIKEGVQNNDTHPAFVQLFLWGWTKVFGLSEAAVRLPFVLAGIGSTALVYFIAKKWFGVFPAYFSSLAMAILSFPIIYSQLARPYSFGLFFSLLAVLCWTNLLFGNNKKLYPTAVLYGIATVLCMLTHYFAFFIAMLVAASGFFFIKKETWKPYLLSGAIALLIFLPHISISWHQFFFMKGIGQWLAKPETDFLWKFILYCFNDSPLVVISIAVLFLTSLLIYHLEISISRFHILSIAWFIIPFAAGYYYSVRVNPVLQNSVLLFSFPFLLLFIFSFFKEGTGKMNMILLGSFVIILLCSTLFEEKVFKKEYFGVFKEINKDVIKLREKYGTKNVSAVLNTSSRGIFNFYFAQMNEAVPFDYFAGDDSSAILYMKNKIDSCKTDFFLYGWSNFRSPYEIPELIKRKYPFTVYDDKHFNSQLTLFRQNKSYKRDTLFYFHTGFDAPSFSKMLTLDSLKTDSTHSCSGKYSLAPSSKNNFCVTLRTTVKKLCGEDFNAKNHSCFNVSAMILPKDTFNAQLVMQLGRPDEKFEWHAKLLNKIVKPNGKWQEIFGTFEIPESAFPDDEIYIYIWNPGKNSFYLDDFTVSSFADSKYNYYKTSYRK